MPSPILPPLPVDTFTLPVDLPEFLDLALNTLGNIGTAFDGFDPVYGSVATAHASAGGILKAIKACFVKVQQPWTNFAVPSENFLDNDLAGFLQSGDVALSNFLNLLPSQAAPPPVETEPTSPAAPGGPPPAPPTVGTAPRPRPGPIAPRAPEPAGGKGRVPP